MRKTKIVEESEAALHVKELYDFKCQVCGQTLPVPGGKYCEAAYLRPLGRPHFGSDSEDNILCLCPNHHVLLDYGAFGIGDDFRLIGIHLYGPLRVHPRHILSKKNLSYHRKHILDSKS
jgi:putative restriction endonuclease